MNGYLIDALTRNEEYKKILLLALKNAINDPIAKIVDTKERKAWIIPHNKAYYLFYKKNDALSIYFEEKKSYTKIPFSYQIEKIKNGELVVSGALLKVMFSAEEKIYENMDPLYIFESTSLMERIKEFNVFLFKKGYVNEEIPESLIEKCGNFLAQQTYMEEIVDEVQIKLIVLKTLANCLGYSSKKKLTYNDGDNQVWVPNLQNSVAFSCQGIKFIVAFRNSDIQVLHFANEFSDYKTEKDVVNAMVAGTFKKKDLVLLINNKKLTYVGDNFGCMEMDVEFALQALEEEMQEQEEISK